MNISLAERSSAADYCTRVVQSRRKRTFFRGCTSCGYENYQICSKSVLHIRFQSNLIAKITVSVTNMNFKSTVVVFLLVVVVLMFATDSTNGFRKPPFNGSIFGKRTISYPGKSLVLRVVCTEYVTHIVLMMNIYYIYFIHALGIHLYPWAK